MIWDQQDPGPPMKSTFQIVCKIFCDCKDGMGLILIFLGSFSGVLRFPLNLNLSYPLVNVYIAMENHHAINGKTHYFDWAIFKFANC